MRQRWRPRLGFGVAFACIADKPRLALLEPQLDLACRAVAVLRETEVDDLTLLLLIVGAALLFAPQEHHEVRILFDGARLTEVGQPRLLRLAHLGLPR